jgi:hypothetical protein
MASHNRNIISNSWTVWCRYLWLMDDLPQHDHWDPCQLPCVVQPSLGPWGRRECGERCTQVISTRMNVLVLYCWLKTHSKYSGLQQWQHLFCSWIFNLSKAQWGQLACFCSTWHFLGYLWGWGLQSLANSVPEFSCDCRAASWHCSWVPGECPKNTKWKVKPLLWFGW